MFLPVRENQKHLIIAKLEFDQHWKIVLISEKLAKRERKLDWAFNNVKPKDWYFVGGMGWWPTGF